MLSAHPKCYEYYYCITTLFDYQEGNVVKDAVLRIFDYCKNISKVLLYKKMKRLMQYIHPHLPKISVQMLIKFSGTLMDLLIPWLLAYILDDIVPQKNKPEVFFYGGLMVFCAVLALCFNIIANRMAIKTSKKITEKIRHDLFVKTVSLSGSQTDGFTVPSLISRLTSDTYNVHNMIDRTQRLGVRAPILLIGGIIITLTLEPVLTLILICILPLLALIVLLVSRKGVKLYAETQEASDRLVRKVQESAAGIRVIKALSKTEYETIRFGEISGEVVKRDQRAGVLMSLTNPTMHLLLNIGLTLVVVVGAYRVDLGLTQTGKIIAFLSYFAIIINALMMVTRLFIMYSKGGASAKRIFEVLSLPQDLKVIDGDTQDKTSYHIEFRNVCFSYNKVSNNLSGISFALKKGKTLGIIGATGSGKSTIINLLLRFYDPDSGDIFIDGKNIKSIPAEEFRQKFGVVFQNDFVLADTIRENIDFGRALPDGQLNNAANAAQADFIQEKDGGMEYKLAIKGANLSGGQKQRLLIARALAAAPEILVLDDCSSALDYITDAAFRRSLNQEFGDSTAIVISQRISSIMNSEKIILLEDGKIAMCGTHRELLSSSESYREIHMTQMGGIGENNL